MSNFWLFFLYFPFITPYSWPPTAFGCVKRISALAFPPIPLYLKSPSPTTLNPQLIFPTYQIPARGSAPLSQGCLVLQVFSALSPRRTQGFTREAYFYPPHPLSSLAPLFSLLPLTRSISHVLHSLPFCFWHACLFAVFEQQTIVTVNTWEKDWRSLQQPFWPSCEDGDRDAHGEAVVVFLHSIWHRSQEVRVSYLCICYCRGRPHKLSLSN